MCIRDQPLNYSIVFNWTSGTKTIPVLSNRAEDEIVYLAIMNDIPFNEIYSVMVSVSVMAPSGSLVGAARGTVQAGCGSTMHIGNGIRSESPKGAKNLHIRYTSSYNKYVCIIVLFWRKYRNIL